MTLLTAIALQSGPSTGHLALSLAAAAAAFVVTTLVGRFLLIGAIDRLLGASVDPTLRSLAGTLTMALVIVIALGFAGAVGGFVSVHHTFVPLGALGVLVLVCLLYRLARERSARRRML